MVYIKTTMKTGVKIAACVCVIFVLLILFALIFFLRAPVLIVDDEPFIALYGKERILKQQILTSITLRRRVKQVIIADGAGPDVLVLALEEAAARPYCVIFPNRYAEGARRYNDRFPGIPAILLTGRAGTGAGDFGEREAFFVFSGSVGLDYYRAGLCAGILAGTDGRGIAALLDGAQTERRTDFTQGLRDAGIETDPLFPFVVSQLDAKDGYAAVVIAGFGGEYLEKNPRWPLVLFTWLNPALTSRETAVIFDDSPWAQAAAAVQMAGKNQKTGEIPAKALIFPKKVADDRIIRGLKNAVRAGLKKNAVSDG